METVVRKQRHNHTERKRIQRLNGVFDKLREEVRLALPLNPPPMKHKADVIAAAVAALRANRCGTFVSAGEDEFDFASSDSTSDVGLASLASSDDVGFDFLSDLLAAD